jgi:Putative beta-barrel porin 2
VKRSVFAASLCLGVFVSGAFAADVSIKGSLSETVEGSDNYFLINTPSGTTFKSLSAVNLDVLARTPTTRYLLDTNYSYYKYFGPGAVDSTPTSGTPANANFSIDHTTELAKYNLAASWSRTDIATTQLAESGKATASGTQNTYNIKGGVTRDLSRTDSITWSAQASTASFTDSTETPYTDVTTTAAWNHILSPTTTLTNSVMFDWFKQDNAANSQRLFWQIMTGLKSQLTHRLTFNASVGEIFVNAYQEGVLPSAIPPSTTSFQIQPGAANGFVWNAGLTYQLLKDTNLSLTAAKTIAPTSLGQLQQSETIGLTLSHDINHASNLSFSTQFAHISSETPADFFSASVSYGYKLTREWRTNLSYTYRQRNDDTGLARSSTILVSLTRDFTLLGNPTAIDAAEKERAEARKQQSVGQVFPTLQ